MPPLVAPMNIVLEPSAGSSRIACTAPATVPLGAASPLCTTSIGPELYEGPMRTKVCAAAVPGSTNATPARPPHDDRNTTRPHPLGCDTAPSEDYQRAPAKP